MSVKAEFQWDPGDPSVGIWPGWGEDTTVTVEMHGMMIVIGFVPDEDRAPEEWGIDQIDVTLPLVGETSPTSPRVYANLGCIENPTYWRTNAPKRDLQLRDLPPEIIAAVKAEWERIQTLMMKADVDLDQAAREGRMC